VDFFALGETTFHPSPQEISSQKKICQCTSNRGYRNKDGTTPKSINGTSAKAQHRTGQKKNTGNCVEDDKPNPTGGPSLLNPHHGFTRPIRPLIKHGQGDQASKLQNNGPQGAIPTH
jgi:hypothetical protein